MEVKTVLPTVIFLSFLHPANAFAPIEVTCLPMDASVVVALLRNADAAIAVTLYLFPSASVISSGTVIFLPVDVHPVI